MDPLHPKDDLERAIRQAILEAPSWRNSDTAKAIRAQERTKKLTGLLAVLKPIWLRIVDRGFDVAIVVLVTKLLDVALH